jgi:hypothetical protein
MGGEKRTKPKPFAGNHSKGKGEVSGKPFIATEARKGL